MHFTMLMPKWHLTQPFFQLSALFRAGLDPGHLSDWVMLFIADTYPYFIYLFDQLFSFSLV